MCPSSAIRSAVIIQPSESNAYACPSIWQTAVCQIDGQAYAFDSDGWMITADRIAEDGHIR